MDYRYIKPESEMTTEQKVIKWAKQKGIFDNSDRFAQFEKTLEEIWELEEGLEKDDKTEIKDAIGDVIVTLIIQSKMNGLTLTECLNYAYNQIKNRTGRMVNGKFVKDE